MANIRVAVAAHKPYWMPADPLYLPLQVGAAGKPSLGYRRDDEGDQISGKNASFCELTGHYWLWKNVAADAYGLCHYRRYFAAGLPWQPKKARILTQRRAECLLRKADVILPKKRHYWIETNASQYAHAHHARDLDATRAVLAQAGDDRYVQAWDLAMARRSGHRFNMFLMKRDCFERYSAWLFATLFALEARLDTSGYSAYDQRVFGFIGERLMDVWMAVNRPSMLECRVVNLENQHWIKKIVHFLRRKLRGKAD